MYTLYIRAARRALAALCCAALLLSLSGCRNSIYANYREVDAIQLVQTLGVDSASDGVRVSISSGAGTDSLPAVVMSREGKSLVAAMESLQDYSAKEELYFSHTRYALLGETAGAYRLAEFLDYIERSTHIRMDTIIFVARGGEAESLITLSGDKSSEVTETLSSIERDIKHSGESYPFSCREIARSLSEYGGALVSAVAGKKAEGSIFTESGKLTVIPSGYGIIKDGHLAGYLDNDQSRGANILIDRYGFGSISLQLSEDELVTLLPEKSSAKFTATFDEGGALRQLLVEVKLDAGVTEMSRPASLFQPKTEKALNAALSREVEGWCSGALERCLETQCDFMGLYGILRLKYPREITNLKEDFITALSSAEISLRVEGEVKHSYNLDKPLSTSGREEPNAQK